MGSAAGAFLSGLYGAVGPKIEELHAREDAMRAPRAQMYVNILSQSQPGTPQYDEAYEQLNKIYGKNKEAKAILGRVKQFTDQLPQRAAGGQQALPAPGQAPPAQPPQSKTAQAALSPPPQPPAAGASGPPPPAAPAPPRQGVLSKIGHALGTTGKNFAENTLGVGIDQRLKEARASQDAAWLGATLTTPTPEQQKQRDFQSGMQAIDEGIEKGYWTDAEAKDMRREIFLNTRGLKGASLAIKTPNLQQKWAVNNPDDPNEIPHAVWVNPKDPNNNFDNGEWKTASEVHLVNESERLAKIRKSSYGPFNTYYQAQIGQGKNDEEARRIAGEMVNREWGVKLDRAEQDMALKTAPTLNLPSVTGVDAQGNVTQTPGVRQKVLPTPQAPNIPGQPAPPIPNSAGQTLQPPPATTPSAAAPAPTQPAAQLTQQGLQPRQLTALPLAQQRQFLERWTPPREFLVQAFEGPKSLINYADLADDPKSQQRLGKTLNLIFDQMDEAAGGAHINADAGPIHIGTGGVGDILSNGFGVPQKLADQKAKIIRDAVNELTPREQEYVNALMASMATSVGMRSLSKQSAAQATVRSIERELPRIGTITPNSAMYLDKMERMYKEGLRGAQGIPNLIIGPDKALLDRIPEKLASMKAKSKGGSQSSSASNLPSNPDRKSYDALPKGAHYLYNGVEYTKK